MEQKLSFSVSCGEQKHILYKLKVENGKICYVRHDIYHYNHGTYSHFSGKPGDEDFDYYVKQSIEALYEHSEKNYYIKFVESLDQETLDKYFQKCYVPK